MNPVARKSNLVVQDVDNETLVYDLRSNKALCLNETSAAIWNRCDGQKSSLEIALLVSRDIKKPVDEAFVWLAIEELKKNDLLENVSKIKTGFEGMNRREMIRKVGLASVIALPMITSIVAPQAANAASICGPVLLTGACSNSNQCQSCNCVGAPSPICCRAGATNKFLGGINVGCVAETDSCAGVQSSCCSNSASVSSVATTVCSTGFACFCAPAV